MLTNPPSSSTSVSSTSLVEVTLTSIASPSLPSVTPTTSTPLVATTQETTVVPTTPLSNSKPPQTPKRKKKSPKPKPGSAPSPGAEVISSSLVASTSAPPPPITTGNNGSANNGRKRSRKQDINLLRDSVELSPIVDNKVTGKTPKRRKNVAKTGTFLLNNLSEQLDLPKNKRAKSSTSKSASAVPRQTVSVRKNKKNTTTPSATSSTTDNSIARFDPQQKIVLRQNEFIDPNLSFTIFPDLSRGLGAIGPSQVILAVESTREKGTSEELLDDLGANKPSKQGFSCQLFSLFLSVPHFLPLKSVYSSGEPFARILRFTALEQYTNGALGKNQVSTFRFYGPRYEKQVPALSASQEKNPKVVQAKKKNPKPDSYLRSLLIIKHPILGFYSRKLVNLKFVVLKRINFRDTPAIIGHLKAKVVQLRRSADLKNIEIYVDESRVPEAASDVNAMNQQDLQPVIQTPSGLVPVITRTTYQAPQDYQLIEQQPLIHQAEPQQFQYVQYQYQDASDLAQELASGSNLILNFDNSAGEYITNQPTFRDETGAQVLILSPASDLHSSARYLQAHQQQQLIQHHQVPQEQQANFYSQEQQPVIVQQHTQQLSASQQLQLQQQQQAYTIQQQEQQQQIIQIQPEAQKGRQIIYLPGTNIPIEIHFEGNASPAQVIAEPSQAPARVYTQPQPEQQLQIQVHQQPQQQFRSGQQIVVQQNQNHFQAVHQQQQQHPVQQQQLLSTQNQVVIRQQQQQQQVQVVGQPTAATAQQTYQYQNVSQQQQRIVVQQQQPQQSTVLQQPQQQQVLSSCVQQPHHHQPQVRFQQQVQQPLLHSQQGQPRPTLQSPPVPPSFQQQQQRPPFQQQPPQPIVQQQESQYQQPRPALPPPPIPQQSLPPTKQKKPKQPKGSKKNATGEGAPDQVPADAGLTQQQLEQLRLRAQPSPAQQSPAAGQSLPAPLGPVPPNFIPPRFANTSQGVLTPVPIPQQQQSQVSQFTPPAGKKSGQKSRSRPPAPPPPIISSTTSLAQFPSVSAGTTSVAPKSQNPSASSAFSPSHQHQQPKKQTKTFVVVSSPTSTSVKAVPTPAPLPPKQEFKTKPGQLAVCPHCGVGNKNILRCNRCKHELPADVKFIKDEWYVNKAGAAVAVPAPKPSSPTGVQSPVSSSDNNNSKVVAVTSSTKPNAKTGSVAGRKILLVNKPQAPSPAPQVSSSTTGIVTNNKPVIAPGTVHIQIQPDGGSAVTINSGGVSLVQSKSAPLIVAKPAPKRRAPARKRQAHECITLSSDEEEPEPPATKVAKQEEKPVASPAVTSASAAELVSSSKGIIQSSTTTTTVATTLTTTATSVKSTTANTTDSKVTGSASSSQNQASLQASETVTVALIKKEGDKEVAADSTSVAQPQDAIMQKQFKINLSLDTTAKPATAEKLPADGPNEVNAKIEFEMGKIGNKFEYATFICRSIRVGSYKVTSADTLLPLPVQLTELGIKFNLPHANYKHKIVKVCIPMECILDIKAHFHKRLQVLFITTGPKYAGWIRDVLGMDGSVTNESSNYYCPMNGRPCQKTITMLGEETLEESDIGTIKKLYGNVLTELETTIANEYLMRVTPLSYRASLGYNASSSESATSSSTGPKIVSTTSMAGGSASPASSQVSNLSGASTVIVNSEENTASAMATRTSANPALAGNVDKDGDGVILFYEGRNNIKVPICPNDIKCLGYSQFLNDQIIDFWMAVIQTEIMTETDKNRTFFFDSFFYSKLTEKMKRKNEEDGNLTAGERRHGRVKKRTKNVDIFSKDYLIVPINENYHWFIAIICFPGLEGYHDYDSLDPLPNYKRPRTISSKASSNSNTNNNKKPVVYNQPKNDTTAAYSNRDEAPEDPEENDQISSPDTPGMEGAESKSQVKTEAGEPSTEKDGANVAPGTKRKSEFGQAVKHPCILIFDSLAGESRGRIYSTLREYLRIEYKTKKNAERIFDKSTMPGVMPKVPQQPNFSDCGLFMLQYVESFFALPIPNYEPKDINLKQWFQPSIAENKRIEIYDFIIRKVKEKYPQNAARIPIVSFEPDENDLANEEEEAYRRKGMDHDEDDPDYFDEEDFDDEFDDSEDDEQFRQMVSQKKAVNNKQPKKEEDQSKPGSDNEDHNYATTPPKPSATSLAASLPSTVVVAITPLPDTSDNATAKKKT